MALIKCSECGKKISEFAVACPKCGMPVNMNSNVETNRKSSQKKVIGILTALFLGLPILLVVFLFWKSSQKIQVSIDSIDQVESEFFTSCKVNLSTNANSPILVTDANLYNRALLCDGVGELTVPGEKESVENTFAINGYCVGTKISKDDFSSILFLDDYVEIFGMDVYCLSVTLNMKSAQTGQIYFDIVNPMGDTVISSELLVIDGKATGKFDEISWDIYKDEKYDVIPKAFISSKNISDNDINIVDAIETMPYFAGVTISEKVNVIPYNKGILIYQYQINGAETKYGETETIDYEAALFIMDSATQISDLKINFIGFIPFNDI